MNITTLTSQQNLEAATPMQLTWSDLEYSVLGTRTSLDSPLVLCFHRAGDPCSSSWVPLAVEVSKSHPLLLYDRAGYGRSARSDHQKPRDALAELASLLSDFSLNPPYILATQVSN